MAGAGYAYASGQQQQGGVACLSLGAGVGGSSEDERVQHAQDLGALPWTTRLLLVAGRRAGLALVLLLGDTHTHMVACKRPPQAWRVPSGCDPCRRAAAC